MTHSLFWKAPGGATEEVEVYTWPYSLSFGIPSADADVVASILPDGSYPTTFVYEKGDALVDGSIAPNKRIGLFLGQTGATIITAGAFEPTPAGAIRYDYLTEAGRDHLMNAVAYAIGVGTAVESKITNISFTTEGVLIEGTGAVSVSPDVLGPYTGSFPLPITVTPDQATQFYKPIN